MTIEDKISILEVMANCVPPNASGEDEDNLIQNFLPLRNYSKLADNKVFLITGGRGSGKTELFRVLTSYDGLQHIISSADKRRYTNLQNSKFIVGYIAKGEGSQLFPTSNVCTKWIKSKSTEEIFSFWTGLLLISLLYNYKDNKEIENIIKEHLGESLLEILRNKCTEISQWWEELYNLEEKWESCLVVLDEYFGKKGEQIFFTYDELDRICTNYSELFAYIRALLSFWFIHNDRFNNIKAKIFLRTDLYHAKALQFVDSSKMRSYRLELRWDSLSLYRMFVKRLANAGNEETVRYLKSVKGLIADGRDGNLGYLPSDSEETLRSFIEKMIGKYMGKTPKRGVSYAWVPNHIQDSNGELAPRPFLKCFAFAAEELLLHTDEIVKLDEEKILSPTRLQGALAEVSRDRVDELVNEEYQWLKNLIERLRGKSMLMDKEEFVALLKPEYWNEYEVPGQTDMEIFDILLTLGIIMETNDGRINVPEIYLYGFGLKRKGGIKRPK